LLQTVDRVHELDKRFTCSESNVDYSNRHFVRVSAKDCTFANVDFKYSIFEGCYLRGCRFEDCNFTGVRFVDTNLHGSRFSGCDFRYTGFRKTNIDPSVLDTECPPFENLKRGFARALRVNYQELGDVDGVNKAIKVELRATEVHLHEAWSANESYYRRKYRGWKRLEMFFRWMSFRTLGLVWGNGESYLRLAISLGILLLVMATLDSAFFHASASFWAALVASPQVFMGSGQPQSFPGAYLAIIAVVRVVALGFLVAILVKKLSRR
jgi:hypothetical protein